MTMQNKKTLIAILALIFICLLFYFSVWAVKFNLRMPRNYNECIAAGGVENAIMEVRVADDCTYKDRVYDGPWI